MKQFINTTCSQLMLIRSCKIKTTCETNNQQFLMTAIKLYHKEPTVLSIDDLNKYFHSTQ